MDEREFDEVLKRAFQHDFSAGTEVFRDELLARCLEALDSDELDDGDLELLAAAGDPNAMEQRANPGVPQCRKPI